MSYFYIPFNLTLFGALILIDFCDKSNFTVANWPCSAARVKAVYPSWKIQIETFKEA
jgi:hypothetical protein